MTSMLDSAQAEARLRHSLAEVRREIDKIVRDPRGKLDRVAITSGSTEVEAEGNYTFEAAIRNAMARIKKLLGFN